ncbi:hypothetical protein SLA2020_074080 [Shorea laevis]
MDWVGPSIEIVKLVGGRFVRYLKYQIKYNDLLQKAEVEDWLKEVEEFIRKQNVVDEVNSWGYLSCCCRAVILEERTQELKEIYDRGDNYTRDCLVIEDHSKKLDYYVQNFNELKEKLQCEWREVDSTLRSQHGYGKIEKEKVKHWREKVEQMLKGVREIEDEIGGRLSHPSDSLVMLLGEKIQGMKRMCEEGSQLPDCLVIDDPSASVVKLPTQELQGSEVVKANILSCLKGEEVTMLGVWGMGGVGKTTIMKHVHNKLIKEGKFQKIIWVTVSQNFDIYNLQEQIACSLKEKLEEHQNTTNRAGVLSNMLEKQKPYLLILDDVWSSFKLEDVGIPEPNVTNGCKLVLTTRSQEVTRSMDCKSIKVETLSKDEALKLFLSKVGDTALSFPRGGIKGDFESTLKEIVDECAGLPLALVTVAGSLKGKSESRLWSVALHELRDCKRNVASTDAAADDAFRILKFSYNYLTNQQIQHCFLYCALYPEDHKIPMEEIIENWIDEGFIDEIESRHAMKDKGYDILRKLEDNSLLEVIQDEGEGDCVRMHDLIRDMALYITRTSPRFLVEAGKTLKELLERVNCAEGVEKVSLMHNYIEEIPSSLAFSTCIRLTTLLLAGNNLSTLPESIFEQMPELKILDLSGNWRLRSLPDSISKMVKLTTLLLESTGLEKVPSLSGLGSLKKLNLRGTKIKEVPEGLGMLKNLKCLFLCGSKHDSILEIDEIADGVLSNLSKLQELIVDKSRIKLKGEVVGRLMKLEVFHGWFPTVNDMRIFLKWQPNRLSSYFIIVGSNLNASFTFMKKLQKIMVFKETSIIGENTLFPSVQVLFIDVCHDIRSLNDFSRIKDATDLKRCSIQNCDGMECVLSSWINNPVVQTLEHLHLCNLQKLDGLFEANVMATSSPPPRAFSSLQMVAIWKCKKIKKLFPSWKLVEYLQSLERIEVGYCEEIEKIIGSNPKEGEEGEDIIKKLILPKLKQLILEHVPALKSICSRRAVMVCDSLEEIEIMVCKGLRRIPFRLLPDLFLSQLDYLDWVFEGELIATSPPQPSPFSSLKGIHISSCNRANKLFPSWKFVEYLQSLEAIEVNYCEEMEEIIGSDPEEGGEEERGDIIKKLILPKLKLLRLMNLPALKSICSRRAVMVCDSLEIIIVRHCKGIRRIPFCLPPRLYLEDLDYLDRLFEVELIATSTPQPSPFSSFKEIEIAGCKRANKLFPSWKFVEYLLSLERIEVGGCEEMKEIIGSDPKEEGEKGGDIIKKLILPNLKKLELWNLPKLKSICSRRAVMVCDFLESITILNCKGLRRIPLSLPLVDNAQPSPPSLKKILIERGELEWWESLEWDHPNPKDMLRPMVQFVGG